MLFAVPSSSGTPSEAIASVKISVPELRSAGRSIGIVTLPSTFSGRAPALRAASSSDESARESDASQVMNATGRSRAASTSAIPDRVDRQRPDVQPLENSSREVAARAPDDDPAEDDAERGEQQREQHQPPKTCAARGGPYGRHRIAIAAPATTDISRRQRRELECVLPGRPELGVAEEVAVRLEREDAAGLVQRAVAQRGLEQRDERPDDEHDDEHPGRPVDRPRRHRGAARAGERRRRGRAVVLAVLVLISAGPLLAEDRVPALRERGPVVDELLVKPGMKMFFWPTFA